MTYDVIVIGGGPAGMFAAITAAQNGSRVLLLERNDRLGKKLLITGKGRCNVTNHCSAREVLENTPRNGRFLFSVMENFPPEKVYAFFEENGCPLKTERGNRVFPVSDRSQSVLDCLVKLIRKNHITVQTDRVTDILTKDGAVIGVRSREHTYEANSVIFAAGGLMETVNVLGDDGFQLAGLFPFCQLAVRRIGQRIGSQQLGAIEPEEFFRVAFVKCMT